LVIITLGDDFVKELKIDITDKEFYALIELQGFLSTIDSEYIEKYDKAIESIVKKYREKDREYYLKLK
jgi:hypothetical protein